MWLTLWIAQMKFIFAWEGELKVSHIVLICDMIIQNYLSDVQKLFLYIKITLLSSGNYFLTPIILFIYEVWF